MNVSLWSALPFSLGTVAFVWVAARTLFRYLEPRHVEADYDACGEGWHEARLARCGGFECEDVLCRVPQQPINTYSNLWYLLWGTLIAGVWGTGAASVFAFVMGYLCVGSMLYHAISTHWAHLLDETGMYATYAALLVYALCRWGEVSDAWTAPLMIVGAALAVGVFGSFFDRRVTARPTERPTEYKYRDWVIAAFLSPAALLPLVVDWRAMWPFVAATVGLFALAYLVRALDLRATLPTIGGRAWGHGLWHLLTALATAMVFVSNALASGG